MYSTMEIGELVICLCLRIVFCASCRATAQGAMLWFLQSIQADIHNTLIHTRYNISEIKTFI